MNKICNIKYIDAYCVYTEKYSHVKLKIYEAYGYGRRNGDDLIIEFIKKTGQDKNDKTITKGLIIPNSAIISKSKKNNVGKVDKGSNVSITWKDIVYIANIPIRECSIMYSEGIVVENGKNYIVLKNPETLRLSPGQIENHPKKKPTFYVIPKSLIIEVEIINPA